jgi:hypothetical protein
MITNVTVDMCWRYMNIKKTEWYEYYNSGYYKLSRVLFKTQRFGDRILSPSSGGTY